MGRASSRIHAGAGPSVIIAVQLAKGKTGTRFQACAARGTPVPIAYPLVRVRDGAGERGRGGRRGSRRGSVGPCPSANSAWSVFPGGPLSRGATADIHPAGIETQRGSQAYLQRPGWLEYGDSCVFSGVGPEASSCSRGSPSSVSRLATASLCCWNSRGSLSARACGTL